MTYHKMTYYTITVKTVTSTEKHTKIYILDVKNHKITEK